MNIIGVGIVGTGVIADEHAAAIARLNPHFQLIGVADISPESCRNFGAKHFSPFAYKSHRELLAREDVDLIAVCTPPAFHHEVVVDALRANKWVLCEKPLATNLNESRRILQEPNLHRLGIVHQLRYHRNFQKTQMVIQSGVLGSVKRCTVRRHNTFNYAGNKSSWWGSWSIAGGGVVITQFSHMFDLLVSLFGQPLSIEGEIGRRKWPIESEDWFAAMCKFKNCDSVHVEGSINAAKQQNEFSVECEHGTVHYPFALENASDTLRERIDAMLFDNFGKSGPPRDKPLAIRALRRLGRLTGLYDHKFVPYLEPTLHEPIYAEVANAIRHEQPLPVPVSEAQWSLELCFALYESALSGIPVTMPIHEDSFNSAKGVTLDSFERFLEKGSSIA